MITCYCWQMGNLETARIYEHGLANSSTAGKIYCWQKISLSTKPSRTQWQKTTRWHKRNYNTKYNELQYCSFPMKEIVVDDLTPEEVPET